MSALCGFILLQNLLEREACVAWSVHCVFAWIRLCHAYNHTFSHEVGS